MNRTRLQKALNVRRSSRTPFSPSFLPSKDITGASAARVSAAGS